MKYYPFQYCRNLEQYRDSRVKLKLWEDEGKVEKEEDEEAEEEEEEDEGTLKVNCQLQAHRSGVASPFGPDPKIMKSVFCVLNPKRLEDILLMRFSEAEMSLAAARPLIGVHSDKNAPTGTTVCLPAVFRAPVRWASLTAIHSMHSILCKYLFVQTCVSL